ncbi:alpha/beta hydrolase [Henriciella aquimarina]|uniref:alpha/beta hydrolase n=1 Tax=Henriciella aquimarina TaxID=545261 RepID=UPI001F173B7B|nr:alpha/beta-hydrolase family protein [Henriciella aquimarina]
MRRKAVLSRRPLGLYMLPLFLGLVFFAVSLTPSLIPRTWLVQGILGGFLMALGYMLGRFALVVWWVTELPVLSGRLARIGHAIIAVPVSLLVIVCLAQVRGWQNGIRERMGMELLDTAHGLRIVLLAVIVFAVLVLLGTGLRILFDLLRNRLDRYMPRRTANIAGLILLVAVLFIVTMDGIVDRAISGFDRSYTMAQQLFDMAPAAPAGTRVTGGEGSLIDWRALGKPGRDFVTGGPDADDISAFTGRPAQDPVRVYVGLAEADTPEERAEIALAELKRLGGFDREVLIVALPTGTGWLDPGAIETVEYMHGGDIATVAAQYSYLQSPLALMLESHVGLDQARTLIGTIHAYWRTLPEETRPRLYMHGLSLGAWASMYGTGLYELLDEPIDGALWAGPPFPSQVWRGITAQRNEDSPYVLPELGNGRVVRFASHYKGATGDEGWGQTRIVFLQYSSDPIVFYEPTSLFRAPQWMREPPAPDVSPDLRFVPIVTQFQLAVDLALATTAPSGHGHTYYAPDYVQPWAAVTAPEPWTPAETRRLMAYCDNGFQKGCGDRYGPEEDEP